MPSLDTEQALVGERMKNLCSCTQNLLFSLWANQSKQWELTSHSTVHKEMWNIWRRVTRTLSD